MNQVNPGYIIFRIYDSVYDCKSNITKRRVGDDLILRNKSDILSI